MGTIGSRNDENMKKNSILDIIKRKNTIFTTKDVALIWGETHVNVVRKKMYRYLKLGEIYHVRKGIYAKDAAYDKYELATRIFTPSYISFETILVRAGFIFQFYSSIFVASYLTRAVVVDDQKYIYKKIKTSILTNRAGIEGEENAFIASPERAFLDTIYVYKNYYFDNLSSLNWDKVEEILPIYGNNKQMEKRVAEHRKAEKNR